MLDIHIFGLKSSVGGKGPRGYHKNKDVKARTRRYFKRLARREGQEQCSAED